MNRKFYSLLAASLAIAGVGMIASAVIGTAKADEWDKMTKVTISERMIAGNKVLEPGTYVWKLLDDNADRHVVQIFNADETHLYETILAIPNYRLTPTGNTRFAFWETPPGVPKAVRAWFYPGDNFGQEFKYPRKLVAQLASLRPVPVPTSYSEQPQPAAAEPAPQPAPVEPSPAPAAAPTPQPAPPVAEAAPTPQPAPAALPHTASNVPLIGFIGIGLVGAAGLLSLKPRRA
jgi:hypothetical protein